MNISFASVGCRKTSNLAIGLFVTVFCMAAAIVGAGSWITVSDTASAVFLIAFSSSIFVCVFGVLAYLFMECQNRAAKAEVRCMTV